MDISIINSIDPKLLDNLPNVSDRYYQHKYCNSLKNVEGDVKQRVSFHSNRLCLISLASDHPAMDSATEIKNVNFNVDEKGSYLKKVSGKSKKGAQKLEPRSLICYVTTSDGKQYPVYSCIKGKLIEPNEQLLTCPNLLKTHSVSNGFIVLILPDLKFYEKSKEEMLTEEQYFNKL